MVANKEYTNRQTNKQTV